MPTQSQRRVILTGCHCDVICKNLNHSWLSAATCSGREPFIAAMESSTKPDSLMVSWCTGSPLDTLGTLLVLPHRSKSCQRIHHQDINIQQSDKLTQILHELHLLAKEQLLCSESLPWSYKSQYFVQYTLVIYWLYVQLTVGMKMWWWSNVTNLSMHDCPARSPCGWWWQCHSHQQMSVPCRSQPEWFPNPVVLAFMPLQ